MSDDFGGSSIDKSMYDWILENLEPGKTILEFGSGNGSTKHLSKHYKMISVEHNPKWVGKHNSQYIWAPVVDEYNWFDVGIIQRHLENKSYDLILVDGIRRWGFREFINMFNTDLHIIIDDIHREQELNLLNQLEKDFGRKTHREYYWGVLLYNGK